MKTAAVSSFCKYSEKDYMWRKNKTLIYYSVHSTQVCTRNEERKFYFTILMAFRIPSMPTFRMNIHLHIW